MLKNLYLLSILWFLMTGIAHAGTVNLPETGQTTSYYSGDDGAVQAGVSWPSPRFTDNGDGTITDNLTGLMWLKDANCFGTQNLASALSIVSNFNISPNACLNYSASYTDWRLPNVNELESLVNLQESNQPTWLNGQGFANMRSDNYISFTSADGWGGPMYIDMRGGKIVRYRGGGNLLPVRGTTAPPAQIWKTGQTTSYYSGDDGAVQAGVSWPSPKFTDNGDGTITDNLTGLMWLKDANCLKGVEWSGALDKVSDLNANPGSYHYNCVNYSASYTDWRLPNRKEFLSLINREDNNLPSGHPFLNVSEFTYWSSTTYPASCGWPTTTCAWDVSMFNGWLQYNKKTDNNSVWAVRSGQGGSSGNSDILVSPTNHDFGSITVGNSSTAQSFTISNSGVADLVIGIISLAGADASEFSAQNDNCSGQTVATSGNCTIDIVFSPTSESVKSAHLSIPSNDPDTPTLNAALSGAGVIIKIIPTLSEWSMIVFFILLLVAVTIFINKKRKSNRS